MTNSHLRFEQLIARLKEQDYRITPQRIELVRLIALSEDHPSAARLYEQVRVQFPAGYSSCISSK